jgi:hypothetical protein
MDFLDNERHGPAPGALLSAAQFDLISIPLEAATTRMRTHGVPDAHIQRFLAYFQARMLPANANEEQHFEVATAIQRHAALQLSAYVDTNGHPPSR